MLNNLNGVEKKQVKPEFFSTVSKGMNLVRNKKYAISGERNGSITIYKDDEGIYRGYRYKYYCTASFIATMKLFELKKWLIKEIPKTK